MLTLSLSEKEIKLLEKSVNTSIKNLEQRGSIDDSEYTTLEKIMCKLQEFPQDPEGPLVSSKEIGYQEVILEH